MPDGANKGSFVQAYNALIAANLQQKPEKVSADTGWCPVSKARIIHVVILSAAKDPEEVRHAIPSRTFLPIKLQLLFSPRTTRTFEFGREL